MAAVEVQLGTPLADALQNAVQPKLVETGWSTGDDDSALAEYVVLMLVNGKSQEEIAAELARDLLGLGPEDQGAMQFAQWLFDTVASLSAELKGAAPPSAPANDAQVAQAAENNAEARDAEMGDSTPDGQGSIPTGPKSMRNNTQRNRDKRMLGQINKNLAGGDAALHRVRGANGVGRINTHSAREPPKGPRAQQIQRGVQAANGRPMGGPMGMQPGQMRFPQQPNMMMGQVGQGPLNPQQQMQLLQMMEQQSQMMANMMAAQNGGNGVFNQAFQNGQGQGKSMFDRVEGDRPNRRGNRGSHNNKRQNHQPSQEGNNAAEQSSSMEVEGSPQQPPDPATTLCRFNLSCTRADCEYAHQSPAAPPGVAVDMTDSCTFGAACKNYKCVGRHPSPAKKFAHQAEIQCSFWPSCSKPNCPFKHPAPLCRNGGDCQVPDCKFTHNTTMCKFNPCKNPKCMFKHAEGQKGVFGDKVWTAANGEDKEHVSERKFVSDEQATEELIIPGEGSSNDAESNSKEKADAAMDAAP